MQSIYHIIINGRFSVIGGYKCDVIKNRLVITKNSIGNQKIQNINNTNPDIQVENI